VLWLHGQGFPKSHDVSKGIDKAAGAKRQRVKIRPAAPNENIYGTFLGEIDSDKAITDEAAYWDGYGTALKPAAEIICLARKPLSEKSVAANVLKWGTGAINVDGCRIEGEPEVTRFDPSKHSHDGYRMTATGAEVAELRKRKKNNGVTNFAMTSGQLSPNGRWPANVAHDGSIEVVSSFPIANSARASGNPNNPKHGSKNRVATSYDWNPERESHDYRDTGSAARFFFTAKADSNERMGFDHPTVKPVDLIQWLVRMVTPKGGWCLDPFAGTGTTGEAAWREKCKAILIEKDPSYQKAVRQRVKIFLETTTGGARGARDVAKLTRKQIKLGALWA
jgi:hypothetical protein